MITLGIDAHKRTHTVVAVDELGRHLGTKTTRATTSKDHLRLLRWADQFGLDRTWAVEDCRHLSRRLERDMLAAGETIVRVPPKLMAHARDGARTYGKSDPIDALAVARAALRERDLPTAHLDDEAREIRLLVDHREDLVAERTRHINRVRWHFHEIDPGWEPKERGLTAFKNLDIADQRLALIDSVLGRIARDLIRRIANSPSRSTSFQRSSTSGPPNAPRTSGRSQALPRSRLPSLSPKSLASTASSPSTRSPGTTAPRRFRSGPGTVNATGSAAPAIVSSTQRTHRIALTQARYHPDAILFIERRASGGDNGKEAVRALKRRLSDVAYRAMVADLDAIASTTPLAFPLAAA